MNDVNTQPNTHKNAIDIAEIDIKELAQTLMVHRTLLAACLLVGFILSLMLAILKLPVYEPSALLQVSTQNNSTSSLFSGMAGSAASAMGMGSLNASASVSQVQMALMQSSYILQPVINSLALNISVTPKYFPMIGHHIALQYEGDGVAPARFGLTSYAWGGESLVVAAFNVPPDNFKEKFTVKVIDTSHYALYEGSHLVLTGAVHKPAVSDNGKISMVITHISARPGTEFYVRRYSNVDTLQSLQNMLEIDQLTAKSSAGAASGGATDTGLIQLSLKSASPMNAVAILNAVADLSTNDSAIAKSRQSAQLLNFVKQEIPISQKNLSDAQARLNQYQADHGLIDLNSQSKSLLQSMTLIDSQIIAGQLNKAQLLQVYTPENPMVQSAEIGIDALNQQKTKLNTQLSQLPAKYQTAIDLMRNVKTYSMLYTQLLMKEQQMEITNAGMGSDLVVLESATPPDQALPTHTSLIAFAGAFAGFIIGALFILVRHALNSGISDPYLVEREFGLRTIGIVPYSDTQAKNKKLFDQKKIKSIPILAKIDNHDPAIESLRSLRTSLSLMLAKKQGKAITISGIIPQIGKSFISINLAATLAESGKKVLLIDADIRKGYLHQYFKKPMAPGLSELLSGVTQLDKALHNTEFKHLDFITCGMHEQNPGDLLLNDTLPQLLQEIERHYDFVIVDTPPMLAVSDASLIAKHCALNLIVVAAAKIQKHEVETVIKQFYGHGVQLDGTVFNFTSKNVQATSKYSHQKYYARYHRKDT